MGHSAGGIAVLNNIYLTREKYNIAKQAGGYLETVGDGYAFSLTTERVSTLASNMVGYYNSGAFDGLWNGNWLDSNLVPPLIDLINSAVTDQTYYTYSLDEFPTVPCIGVHGECRTDLTEGDILAQRSIIDGYGLKGSLDRGVAFSGAILETDWMIGNTTPVADIHHDLDGVVSIEDDEPFGTYGDLLNLYNIPFTNRLEKVIRKQT